jgi:choline dehydrogenase
MKASPDGASVGRADSAERVRQTQRKLASQRRVTGTKTCTATMGQEAVSVVDASLRVYGVERLRVADGR